jgi:hypothetical protein
LRHGDRGLPGGSSLARLLHDERGVRNIHDLGPLTEEMILAWADAYHARTGSWPTAKSGIVRDSGGERWSSISAWLRNGGRGLSGGSSLAKLLAKHRGTRNRKQLSRLTVEQILTWADAHHERTGKWPGVRSGPIAEAPGETWTAVQMALRAGLRGFPGGSSLPQLLAQMRGVRNVWSRPRLSIEQILAWADALHQQTGRWPTTEMGPIAEAPGETWHGVHGALSKGLRGLPGGSSLAKLLEQERGVRNRAGLPRLSRKQILAWAQDYFRRTGQWPTRDSGPIPNAPSETWSTVDTALHRGSRGLRGRSSLAKLLGEAGKIRTRVTLSPLSKKKILRWAETHFQRTGKWPNVNSGPVADAPGERWDLIDQALRVGNRGLQGGSSLLLLLAKKRGVRHPYFLPALTHELILDWARQHFHRTGTWPSVYSGDVAGVPGETWRRLDWSLRNGKRGLNGGSSLATLLDSAIPDRREKTATGSGPVVDTNDAHGEEGHASQRAVVSPQTGTRPSASAVASTLVKHEQNGVVCAAMPSTAADLG